MAIIQWGYAAAAADDDDEDDNDDVITHGTHVVTKVASGGADQATVEGRGGGVAGAEVLNRGLGAASRGAGVAADAHSDVADHAQLQCKVRRKQGQHARVGGAAAGASGRLPAANLTCYMQTV